MNRERMEHDIKELFNRSTHVNKVIIKHALEMHGIVANNIDDAVMQLDDFSLEMVYEDCMNF